MNYPDGVTQRMCNPYNEDEIFCTCDCCGGDILYGDNFYSINEEYRYCTQCVSVATAEY